MHKTLLSAALLAALTFAAGTASARSPAVAEGATSTGTEAPAHRGHGRPGLPRDPVDALARLDTDGDGRISRAEAEAGQQAWQARREARLAAHAARDGARKPHGGPHGPHARGGRGFDLVADFASIDRDGDGYLTRSELRRWHDAKQAERRTEGERRFDAMFRAADLNGDGRLSRVEVDEAMPWLAPRFAWFDENRDGTLSREELRAARPQR
ncbi:EF-hand domain-containing protein [Luteimonas sp. S4-F44]|uniref:EF-hand domain-containing protein n=1 Tax=Luteimonas sp. S4-F44 TaxID=2925842 RepID=UPI001F53152E|nr:EF-hand domain-containing protein [Luteimonas sp. S4-F44]UNK43682.1 EF-hand domain-containing protein [Luteimonas sp. S4-F44]